MALWPLAEAFSKFIHEVRNLDLLRAYSLTGMAGYAGRRVLFHGDGHERHGGDEILAGGGSELIVQGEESWNVQMLRAVAHAVVAGRAGNSLGPEHLVDNRHQAFHFGIVKRQIVIPGRDILLHLLGAAHTGKNHGHIGHTLQEAESPFGDRGFRTEGLQLCFLTLRQVAETAAAQRLHNPDRDPIFL